MTWLKWSLHTTAHKQRCTYLYTLLVRSNCTRDSLSKHGYERQWSSLNQIYIYLLANGNVLIHKSLVMRKPDLCICENKRADQLHSHRGNNIILHRQVGVITPG